MSDEPNFSNVQFYPIQSSATVPWPTCPKLTLQCNIGQNENLKKLFYLCSNLEILL